MRSVNMTGVNVHLFYTDGSHQMRSLFDVSLNIVGDNSISQLQQRCRCKYLVSLQIHVLFWNNCLKMKKSNWSRRVLTYDSLPRCAVPRQFHDPHTSIMYLKPHNQNLKLIDPSMWTCSRIEFTKYELRDPVKMSKETLHKELIGSGEVGRILWSCCIYISNEFALSWLLTSLHHSSLHEQFSEEEPWEFLSCSSVLLKI